MTQETKHTPLPWATQRGSIVGNGEEVAVLGEPEPSEWDLANADLIVKAVNAHSALVEALERAPIPSKYHGVNGFEYDRFMDDYQIFAEYKRAALSLAREV